MFVFSGFWQTAYDFLVSFSVRSARPQRIVSKFWEDDVDILVPIPEEVFPAKARALDGYVCTARISLPWVPFLAEKMQGAKVVDLMHCKADPSRATEHDYLVAKVQHYDESGDFVYVRLERLSWGYPKREAKFLLNELWEIDLDSDALSEAAGFNAWKDRVRATDNLDEDALELNLLVIDTSDHPNDQLFVLKNFSVETTTDQIVRWFHPADLNIFQLASMACVAREHDRASSLFEHQSYWFATAIMGMVMLEGGHHAVGDRAPPFDPCASIPDIAAPTARDFRLRGGWPWQTAKFKGIPALSVVGPQILATWLYGVYGRTWNIWTRVYTAKKEFADESRLEQQKRRDEILEQAQEVLKRAGVGEELIAKYAREREEIRPEIARLTKQIAEYKARSEAPSTQEVKDSSSTPPS